MLTAGAALGVTALLTTPLVVAAQDDDDHWLTDVLSELVEDGTLTEDHATAVEDAIESARPEGQRGPFDPDRHQEGRLAGPGHVGPWGEHGHGGPFGRGWFVRGAIEDVADTLGLGFEEVMSALRDGHTLAELAETNGDDPQAIVDALVADAQERLDRLVESGRLEAAAAAERLAEVSERIAEAVNEGFPPLRDRHRDADDEGSDTDRESTATTDDAITTTTTG